MTTEKPQNETMDITTLLRRRRIEAGISQDELAKHCGFGHRSTISRLEAGQQRWRLKDALKACELLQIKIELSF